MTAKQTLTEEQVSRMTGLANVAHGAWGERQAESYLASRGWRVIGRNERPCNADRRCEIDRIFLTREKCVVFVEVKTHQRRSVWANRLLGVDRQKKQNLRRACANWLAKRHWHGNFRFDVVEVWGSENQPTPPCIDHIENVPLFGANWRFW